MSKRLLFLAAPILLIIFLVGVSTIEAQNGCSFFATGSITPLTSVNVSFECAEETTVHFGACDSGGVPNDDLFEIEYAGQLVSRNYYVGALEYVDIGSATANVGMNTATLASVNETPFPPATVSIAIAPDRNAVESYLRSWCGVDFKGFEPPRADCTRNVPVFTTDQAPSAGKLEVRVQFGEQNRVEGWTLETWDITEGQQLNNVYVSVPAPHWVRVWWQPADDSQWHLLPSQYWHGDGTAGSEYGIDCTGDVASYHTSFADAIPEGDVPLFSP